MVNYASTQPPRRSQPWLWLGLALLTLVIGLLVGRYAFPATTAGAPSPTSTASTNSGSFGGPHGPHTITQGVPSDYSDDQAGAATAAVNTVQLVVALAHGQADPATAARMRLASNADAAARQALSTQPDNSGDQTSKSPASTRVTAFTPTDATVQVWIVSVGSTTGIGGSPITAEDWSTDTIRLTWQHNDWKVVSLHTAHGPKPGDSTTAAPGAPLQNGLYTFYIN
jgi:hypothetical protein